MADQEVMAYCVKEKAQKPMKDPQPVTLKNSKHAVSGTCSSCGTKMMKFVSSKKVSTEPVAEKEPQAAVPVKGPQADVPSKEPQPAVPAKEHIVTA